MSNLQRPEHPDDDAVQSRFEKPPNDLKATWWGSGNVRSFVRAPNGPVTPDVSSYQEGETLTFQIPTDTIHSLENVGESGQPTSGRYKLDIEIGRGGVGSVYRAWDVFLHRWVALKVLKEEHRSEPGVRRRFHREAQVTGWLRHHGIPPIYEIGTSPDGLPFFAMQLVDGQTLEEFLHTRTDPAADLPRLLTVFLRLAQAVAHAHAHGIIHRDLKPANIMIGDFGVVLVMDWGLAKVIAETNSSVTSGSATRPPAIELSPSETQEGTVFGTPAYLPPEQARGEIARVDKRADVFGMGAILCEILTGEPPYTGADGREVYSKAKAADLELALARLDGCVGPLDVIQLAKWCLSADPTQRPGSAGDVVEVMTNHMQADQRRAEQDLVRFFNLTLDLFCIAGTDGYFHQINDNFPRLLGYPAETLLSQPFIDFVHPDDVAATIQVSERMAAGESCVQFVNRYKHLEGHYLHLEWNAQAVPEERAIYAVARDVTHRVAQAESDRRAEAERLHLATAVDSADE